MDISKSSQFPKCATTYSRRRINGKDKGQSRCPAQRDSDSGVLGLQILKAMAQAGQNLWLGVDVSHAHVGLQELVAIDVRKEFKESKRVGEKPVRRITGDRERMVHDAAYSHELVNYAEAVHLVHDMFGVAAVRHQVELAPIERHRVSIQVEASNVTDDIQGCVVTAELQPEVSGLATTEVLVTEIAHTPELLESKRGQECNIGVVHCHEPILAN